MDYLSLLVSVYIAISPAGSLIPSQLVDIAQCESGLMQSYPDGTLVTNPESGAMGLFQFLPSHQKEATLMGLDLAKPVDNIEFAIRLYNLRGTKDWEASRFCWQAKELAINAP